MYLCTMQTNTSDSSVLHLLAACVLPEGILEFFNVVRVDEEPSPKSDTLYSTILHIHLDELDNRTDDMAAFRPNGFTEASVVQDFPIRDRKVVLHVRRRRWINEQGKNVVQNVYPLIAKGTRYSQEFADFFKEAAG